MNHLRLREKLATWRRDNGFGRVEVLDEWWQQSSQKHVYSVEDPKHSQINVHFDLRRPPTPHELTEIMWAEVNGLTGTHAVTAAAAAAAAMSGFRVVTVKGLTVELSVEEEIPLDARVCLEERIEGRMKPERIALESSSAGTDPGAPGQQRLSSWEMQRTTADGCSLVDGSLDLGEITSLKDFLIKVELNDQTPFVSKHKITSLQMSLQPEDKVIMSR